MVGAEGQDSAMSQKKKQRHSRKNKSEAAHPRLSRQGSRKKWMTWVVVFLMLAAMFMYVVSDDESMPPQDILSPTDSPAAPEREVPGD